MLQRVGLQISSKLSVKPLRTRSDIAARSITKSTKCYGTITHGTEYIPPNMVNLRETWTTMSKPLQSEICEYLDWMMEEDWKHLSTVDKQAAYYIAYGECGPRKKTTEATGRVSQEVNMSYIILRVLFNITLFSAAGIAMYNLQLDKRSSKKEYVG